MLKFIVQSSSTKGEVIALAYLQKVANVGRQLGQLGHYLTALEPASPISEFVLSLTCRSDAGFMEMVWFKLLGGISVGPARSYNLQQRDHRKHPKFKSWWV